MNHTINTDNYQQQLDEKIQLTLNDFKCFNIPALDIFRSKPIHYRMRAEFRVWHENNNSFYAMFNPETKQPIKIESFPQGSRRINEIMPILMTHINHSTLLKKRLFQIEFLTNKAEEAIVTLIYHRQLNEDWKTAALELQKTLNIHIIGRARKQKIILNQDYLIERFQVNDNIYYYQQVENSFTQPNAIINEKILQWVSHSCKGLQGDLLELYCGNGNFTCILASQFNHVLATEISKVSVKSAIENFKKNKIINVKIARLSSEELTQAMNNVRQFNRLKEIDLNDYQFSCVLVDPPRAGLDNKTLLLVQQFDIIIYISCNPDTLKNNLNTLYLTHKIKHIALFDQFPYTHHREIGVILDRKSIKNSTQ